MIDIITRLISIDSSSSKTGWCLFENAKYIKSGSIDLDTNECKKLYKGNTELRVEDMCKAILEILREYEPDIIVIEKLSVNRNMASVRTLCRIIDVVFAYSILNDDVFYYEIQPSKWRSKLGMQGGKGVKREEYKKMSVDYVKNLYDVTVTDDESDAICIGLAYIALMNELIKEEKK